MSRGANDSDDKPTQVANQRQSDLNEMMRRGRSFSGRERNCVFLNTGRPSTDSPRFADISAASGIDWPDDGRGVAITDWDGDGDLDMWISNRNAPRVRLMRNETKSDHHFVALRLAGNGTDTNRDAIGARVAVHLAGEETPLLQTLRAGEGFVAQSTKWLHFGLGSNDQIDRVEVRWPRQDDALEVFRLPAVDKRYRLEQASGEAVELPPREDAIGLAAGEPEYPKPVSSQRIPVVSLLRIPPVQFASPSVSGNVATGEGKAVLFNLWGSWCRPCREELAEFTARAKELRRAGIEVVAISVDAVDQDRGNVDAAKKYVRQLRFPFVVKPASEGELELFQAYDSILTTLNRPLPIPSSFLIDGQGRLAVIYKGRVGVDQLLEDVAYSYQSLDERWVAAAALPGSLVDHEKLSASRRAYEATIMFRHALSQLKNDQLEQAIYHLGQAVRYRANFAQAHDYLGAAYSEQGNLRAALRSLQTAVAQDPQLASAHYHLAMVHVEARAMPPAVLSMREAVRANPEKTFELTDLATLLSRTAGSEQLMTLGSNVVTLHRRVAWLMATSPDDQMRNGEEAVRWAKRVVDVTARRQPGPLWTLAAAYAEVGRFEEAITVAKEAQTLIENFNLPAAQKDEMLGRLDEQIEFYARGEPYREAAASPAAGPQT
ncbi:MAG: hypothetical protein DWQ35_02365 [Planctomycetota bacterium]|nr:MAG: hypothetical protein DWQ35_02365 [Planctomycetota bacterium]REK27667.1 MAG: hypothetical protein DWQ42_06805 [Planctomycetota bacterium]REK38490.1 MAG: hypothetical protein DWQ46_20380 [Planctomycetota bacterium]